MANIDLLCIINEERKKFGLRDSDYHRYRIHCTHKLKTLRKSTGLQQTYNQKTKQFDKRPVDSLGGTNDLNLKYFLINLFQVEHAWASSRELKEQVQSILKKANQQKSDQSTTKTGASRVRHHANNRLTKAIQHSDRFLDLCHSSDSLSIRTLAQLHVHRLYMRGLLEFELARWDSALDHFGLSCQVLKALANSTVDQTEHKKRAIFDEASDELAPMIRYCAYKTDTNAALEIDTFCQERLEKNPIGDKLVGRDWQEIESLIESSKQIIQETIELKWLDQLIPIRNPELVELITSVQSADRVLLSNLNSSPSNSADPSQSEGHLNKKQKRQKFLQTKNPKMNQRVINPTAAFDQALSTYVNVESGLQTLIESNNRALELNSTIQRFDQQSMVLGTIHSIVGFRLLSTRVNRDLQLVQKLETKWHKLEPRVSRRIHRNPKNYHQINRLVLAKNKQSTPKTGSKFNHHRPSVHSYETELIKSLLIKRRQAKLFPSLLKLFDDILFNLERIKQLKVIEDDAELSLKIETKVSFFKAYRSLIQSKSYLLVEKFLESYVLQQKSNYYLRQTQMNLEETSQEEEEEDMKSSDRHISDLNREFLKFDCKDLKAISSEVQGRMSREIEEEWWTSRQSKKKTKKEDSTRVGETEEGEKEEDDGLGRTKLEKLRLDEPQGQISGGPEKMETQVFDLAFNYVTQFDWHHLHPNPSSTRASISTTQQTVKSGSLLPASSATGLASSPASQPARVDSSHTLEPESPPPPPPKKSGGLWSFFSRS
ncbi:hypothetical protein PGT21_014767 [Puccinia graminis f. sp. tritici]|uniref:Signal recognition particle subunit SRP68 n=1 Tax=Puccinia graminis f. sp. tritici TaxID=56615 RepID=A0A5B0Q2Y2_PUCGR|nr:hypothetical protein PGT21_014767 [Puccinia graminis f. sp. tritici]KAA1124731.1 hypothetical protein PGTUg99_032934 [Puccinia graminis f. sp. tritici]